MKTFSFSIDKFKTLKSFSTNMGASKVFISLFQVDKKFVVGFKKCDSKVFNEYDSFSSAVKCFDRLVSYYVCVL